MKATTLSLVLSASSVANAVMFVSGPGGWAESIGFNGTDITWPDLPTSKLQARAAAPKRQEMKNRNPHIAKAKTVKLRYGPYTVPAPRVAGGEGMIWNQPTPSVPKPCAGKCLILGMNAGLEYEEGADANTDTKMWLHHMVLFNIGTKAWDATCTVFGLPHMIVGSLPASSERIFSSGNERTMAFFNPPTSKSQKLGYPIFPADRFGLIADLMNMNPQAKRVYLTLYYDYIEDVPKDYEEIKPVWFDAFQCGTSERGGGSPGSNFVLGDTPWYANFEGEVMGVGGHIHDGGTKLEVLVNDKVVCTSTPTYGSDAEAKRRADIIKTGGTPGPPPPETKADMGGMDMGAPKSAGGKGAKQGGGHGHGGGQHIIAMSVCSSIEGVGAASVQSPLGIQKLVKGQKWNIKAYYDYKKYDGMKNNAGGMDSVMGISIMYIKTSPRLRG